MAKRKKRQLFWGSYTVAGIKHLSQDKELSLTAVQLFFALIGHMSESSSYNNEVIITQKILSEELDLAKSTVSKGIGVLISQEYIIKITSGFMVNPIFFYIGKRNQWEVDELREKFNTKVANPKYEIDEETNTLEVMDIDTVEKDYDSISDSDPFGQLLN